jgi:transposase InsO family protein
MQKYASNFRIEMMAKVLQVSRAGYYKYLDKEISATKQYSDILTIKIKSIHKQSKEVYGSPRIHAELKKQGEKCSRKRVCKIMNRHNIQAKTRKKWKPMGETTRDLSKVAPNILNQNFTTCTENTVWVTDITYIRTTEGWLYLSAVLDLYSRKIVGLSMGRHIDTDLVLRSLTQALCHRMPKPGLILHSDRGTQYTSTSYKNFTMKAGMVLSMSAQGHCYDNAAMESFFHTLKTEHVYFCQFKSRQEAISSIFEYVEVFYNRQRIHSTLGYLSPLEFEQQRAVLC